MLYHFIYYRCRHHFYINFQGILVAILYQKNALVVEVWNNIHLFDAISKFIDLFLQFINLTLQFINLTLQFIDFATQILFHFIKQSLEFVFQFCQLFSQFLVGNALIAG